MIQFIRMLEDRAGAYDHINIVTYVAGEVYSLDRFDPPISQDLLDGFVASGHAIEVDADGNPVATPASKRQTKVTGPKATKDASAETSDASVTDATVATDPMSTDPETPPAE